MKTKITHKEDEFLLKMQDRIMLANRMIIEDIHREANHKTPMRDNNLRRSVSKRVEDLSGIITWIEPYAQYQERGRRYKPPYHAVKNYTTPGTGKLFAKRAVEKVLKDNVIKYFRDFLI